MEAVRPGAALVQSPDQAAVQPAQFVSLLQPFVPLFPPETWRKAQILLAGAVLRKYGRPLAIVLTGSRLLSGDELVPIAFVRMILLIVSRKHECLVALHTC